MSGHDHDHGAAAAGNRSKLILVFAITFTVMVAEIIDTYLTRGRPFAGAVVALVVCRASSRPLFRWPFPARELV